MRKIRVTILMDVGDVTDGIINAAVAHHARTLTASLGGYNTTSSWAPDVPKKRARRAVRTVSQETILRGTRWE